MYDVHSAHMHESGFARLGRTRVKGITATGTSSASDLNLFDTDIVPVTGAYAQSGKTVTVTKSNHGLSTGDKVGISFNTGTGGATPPGNYEAVVTGANTFTLTVLNSGTITGNPACFYVTKNTDGTRSRWLFTKEFSATDIYANIFDVPGRGMLAIAGVYMRMSNINTADIFYEG